MPKKILFLHRGGNQIRGTEEALLTLLRRLDRSRFEPIVFYSSPAMGEAVAELGVEGRLMVFPEIMLTRGEQRFPLLKYGRELRRLTRFCRARNVELLICNGGLPCQLGVPAARRLRKPLVCLFHHPAPATYYRQWLLKHADAVLFASRFTADHVVARTGKSGEVVYIGIDAEGAFSPAEATDPRVRASCGIGAEELVFAQVGALVPHKEHPVLIDAFASVARQLPESRLMIIGTGPEAPRIEALVRERGLSDRVTLTGYVDDIAPFFRHATDVHVLPSREEGLGLVNLQASACRVPNIGSDGTGIRESIIHGETGYLFPPGDAEALARYMLQLGTDEALRRVLGENGRRLVLQRFSNEGYCERFQEVIEEVVHHGGPDANVKAMRRGT